jgi:hypothetical protein
MRIRSGVILFVTACAAPRDPVLAEHASSVASTLTRLRAHNDASSNYYGFSFSGAIDFHRVYIDSDEVASTGFDHCGLGANYMIENTRLYAYSGDGDSWSWTQVATLTPAITSTSASWAVARSLMSETASPNSANVCFETEDTADVRDTSGVYAHAYSDESQPIHAQVAYNDGSQIFYQATFDNSYTHKHVFIDADENAATGYSAGGIGADYMVENNSVYDYTGTGSNWSWTSLGSSGMSPSTTGAIGLTTWTFARSLIQETATPERARLVFNGSPMYTAVYTHAYSGSGTTSGGAVDTSYVVDTAVNLRNPERGMYFGYAPDPNNSSHFHTVVADWLRLGPYCNTTLTWGPTGKDDPLTSPVLKAYAEDLEYYRGKNAKVLFRPRYDISTETVDNGPSGCVIAGYNVFHAQTMAVQKNHIEEIAKMLGAYKDVIAFMHMGYLGRWGEWNTADYPDETAPFLYDPADRAEIVDHVLAKYALAGLTQDVELRRPVLAKEVLARNPSANIGFHNDCFMSNSDDYDTYENFESGNPANFTTTPGDAIAWAQTFTQTANFGGETCGSASSSRWSDCDNMVGSASEPASLHMSYLNAEWAANAVTTWTTGGCYDEIRSKLGYRFEVVRVEYPQTVGAGQSFTVHVDIYNSGWARLHKPRTAKLVLRGPSVVTHTPANSATNGWAPGSTTRLTVTANAPATTGSYQLRLAIPDPFAPSKIPYAVKLASKRGGANVFDAATGENNLGVSITVQ